MNRRQRLIVAIALAVGALAVLPAAAQTFAAGTDPWTTPGGGQTQVNLDSFPAASVLGSTITSSHSPSLKGVPLDSTNMGSPDTLMDRGAISSGQGSLTITALNLAAESDVVLADGRHYSLQVCLSDTGSSSGSIALTRTNSDGGTFNSSFSVLPKLVFTNTSNPNDVVTIDCGSVRCDPLTMSSSNSGWVNTGGSGNFSPSSKGIPVLPTGQRTVANCNGTHTVNVNAPGGFYAGWSASAPTFPQSPPGEQHTDLSWHQPKPPTDCAAQQVNPASAGLKATATAIARKICAVQADPVLNQ